MALLALFLACALSAAHAQVAIITGTVERIYTGDTLTVKGERIRLRDVDAPLLSQPFGAESKMVLTRLCLKTRAVVTVTQQDSYGPVIGRVVCDGVDAQAVLVRTGFAWVRVQYGYKDSPLYALEREARERKEGLWCCNPTPPWEWRRRWWQRPRASPALTE